MLLFCLFLLLASAAFCISKHSAEQPSQEGLTYRANSFLQVDVLQQLLAAHFTAERINQNAALYSCMFSAACWVPEAGLYVVVSRLYMPHEASYLLGSLFDADWKSVDGSRSFGKVQLPGIVAVPSKAPKKANRGPEDARIFLFRGRLHCLFNMLDNDGVRKQWLFDFASGQAAPLYHARYETKPGVLCVPLAEKNWTPLVVGDRLLLLYNYRGMQLVEWLEGSGGKTAPLCRWLQGEYVAWPGALRGGTPFAQVPGRQGYFFSLAFTHVEQAKVSFYRPALTIVHLASDDRLRLVHAGRVLAMEAAIEQAAKGLDLCQMRLRECDFLADKQQQQALPFFASASQVRAGATPFRILTVPSLAAYDCDADQAVATVNWQDAESMLVRIDGLPSLVDGLCAADVQAMGEAAPEEAEAWARSYFNLS